MSNNTSTLCEVILFHHPDCECKTCKANQDATCDKPAVGFTQYHDDVNRCCVCDEHAKMSADDPEAYGVLTYWLSKEK